MHPAAPGGWSEGPLPANVWLGQGSLIRGPDAFKRLYSRRVPALRIGVNSTADGVRFAIGAEGRIEIGDFCYLNDCILLCEQEIRIGSYVMIGWNTTIADTDFHPLSPAERIEDAIACSPLAEGRPRPPIARRPVAIGDDVVIGPACTILKGVRIGAGATVEPGTVLTEDVPAGARAYGNPAVVQAGGARG